MEKGKFYLIPTYLSSTNNGDNITNAVKNVIRKTSYYLVENVRTARRYIASLQLGLDIETIHFESMDKHFDEHALPELFKPLLTGENMGILSEAGLPAIADPGNLAVRYAHQEDLEVVCLEGASSIILGLISSGLNGQQFTFHGYLPIDSLLREKKIKGCVQFLTHILRVSSWAVLSVDVIEHIMEHASCFFCINYFRACAVIHCM